MPSCKFQDCNKPATTRISIFDPFNWIEEKTDLCQIHSDTILKPYIEPYQTYSEQINYLQKTIQQVKIANLDSLDKIQKTKEFANKIKVIRQAKDNFSNHRCRNPLCDNEIKKGQIRYIVDFKHKFGFRHYLYFDKLDCLNTLKAKIGLYVPILEKQLSIAKYV